ncbi:serine/threonine-protein kinase [Tuwongella immobilis]|uniref:Protein kinase domain-containing protein n=1 Tax=Tuwongella immobilis TaxID=692036 RepID=A0A6C2YSU0_9BACT|nr:serine/threonine-protein kinase [Tuwongella immobilis]VIP04397.1 serine threonine protein kinase : Uncultured bacterium genome assembly Metasoil_fosmids_resub OS=uncultured bacterium PE=4 SV=1: Pkinase [Tuwongella immobilis]VTS06156.1 serine threonine protein kinase : Uncultured bacterium genome assembly Metasoil_fosmids_resub OS=uncultured bacterium PE=4 SV=1: Pkinase [Tuwongella immobilis]
MGDSTHDLDAHVRMWLAIKQQNPQLELAEFCQHDSALIQAIHDRLAAAVADPAARTVAAHTTPVDTSLGGSPVTVEHSLAPGGETRRIHVPGWIANCFLPAESADELGRLGPYRIRRKLAEGGFGAVFEAEDPRLQSSVAIKVLKPAHHSPDQQARFLQEARTIRKLDSEYIVPLYAIEEHRGLWYLVMPFLRGRSLDDRLRMPSPIPMVEILRIGREIAIGLQHAHDQGLVHRDIKPGNIWLKSPNDRVQILDFGLARETESTEQMTSGHVVGTPAYMPPEQAMGQRSDARSDLFSLGCVLYQMVTGRRPFDGSTIFDIIDQILRSDPTPVITLVPSCPPGLATLIGELLEKSPECRPASAAVVAERLLAIDSAPSQATPPTSLLTILNRGILYSLGGMGLVLLGLVLMGQLVSTGIPGQPGFPIVSSMKHFPNPDGGSAVAQSAVASPAIRLQLAATLIRPRTEQQWRLDARQSNEALPARNGDLIHLEMQLNPPAYLYSFWVDGAGEVTPLYPWNPQQQITATRLTVPVVMPTRVSQINSPAAREGQIQGWPLVAPGGVETIIAMARNTPFPERFDWNAILGRLPACAVRDDREFVQLSLRPSHWLTTVALRRGPAAEAKAADGLLSSMLERLRPHVEAGEVLRFAHAP